MDKVKVDVPREAPPEWARPQTSAQAPDPNAWTDRQKTFVLNLIQERKTPAEHQEWFASLVSGERSLTKRAASELIEKLLKLPKEIAKDEKQPGSWQSVPAGRYAVDGEDGLLKFYQVWRAKDNEYVFRVYVLHGPDESAVHKNAVPAIMTKIAADTRAAAIRYGMEIGSCSNCGRRLTNHISRELGIGPVCGGRMFGDDFSTMVSEKRTELWDRGINPDEELND